jgi:hypothetical protein
MEFIEAPAFTRHLSDYLSDEQYQELQMQLALDPEAGDLMQGTGGFRKVRWVDPRRGKGRRGGLRIIYYYFASDQQIWLVALYSKGDAADLAPDEKRVLKDAVQAEVRDRARKRGDAGRKTKS